MQPKTAVCKNFSPHFKLPMYPTLKEQANYPDGYTNQLIWKSGVLPGHD
jgi:hypothetical protein